VVVVGGAGVLGGVSGGGVVVVGSLGAPGVVVASGGVVVVVSGGVVVLELIGELDVVELVAGTSSVLFEQAPNASAAAAADTRKIALVIRAPFVKGERADRASTQRRGRAGVPRPARDSHYLALRFGACGSRV
jgi:hypothetical protein